MNVKGNHDFKVSREKLWSYLMDPDVLAKITPGVTKLEILATDSYQSVSDIKIGPVKGSFKGNLQVQDKNEPSSFAINMEQLSKIGNAHATITMNLEDKGANLSALSFDGKAKLSGVIARTGQRVLSGVANTITREIFVALDKHIEEDQAASTTPTTFAEKMVNDKLKTKLDEIERPIPIQEVRDEYIAHTETTQDNTSIVQEREVINEEVKEIEATTNQVTEEKATGFIAMLKNLFGIK